MLWRNTTGPMRVERSLRSRAMWARARWGRQVVMPRLRRRRSCKRRRRSVPRIDPSQSIMPASVSEARAPRAPKDVLVSEEPPEIDRQRTFVGVFDHRRKCWKRFTRLYDRCRVPVVGPVLRFRRHAIRTHRIRRPSSEYGRCFTKVLRLEIYPIVRRINWYSSASSARSSGCSIRICTRIACSAALVVFLASTSSLRLSSSVRLT